SGVRVRRGGRAGGRGGAPGALLAGPHLPAAVTALARAGVGSGGRPGRPRPRPVHPQLRRPGHRGGVGAGTAGRAAGPPARAGPAGVLPARRGDGPLPGRTVPGSRRGGGGVGAGGDPAPVRRHPGPLPDARDPGRPVRRREVGGPEGPPAGNGRDQAGRGRSRPLSSHRPHRTTITPTAAPRKPYDSAPTIAPAITVPLAPHTFMIRSDSPCTAGRRSSGTASVSIADPATSPHDQPVPSRNSPMLTWGTSCPPAVPA